MADLHLRFALPREVFQLIEGAATPRPRTLTGCRIQVEYWNSAVDDATDALVGAKVRDIHIARARLNVAIGELQAAEARLARAESEAAGARWLASVGGGDGR